MSPADASSRVEDAREQDFPPATMARSLIIVGVLATYAIAVLQSSVAARLAVFGVAPDLLLVWTVCLGLLRGPAAGAVGGWASGLLQGALEERWIGAYAIGKTVGGFLAGGMGRRMFRENWLVPALCAALLTVANEACFLVLARSPQLWSAAGRVVAIRMAYHAALAPFVLAAMARGERALTRRKWQPE